MESEVVEMLTAMGFNRDLSLRAAQLAGETGVEGALELIESNPELLTAPGAALQSECGDSAVPSVGVPRNQGLKAVFVVRKDLQMSPGKIAAQVAHAALALARNHETSSATDEARMRVGLWQTTGEKIVVVEADGPEQMAALQAHARQMGLIQAEICDAGRTEVESGTNTVCGFGPHYEEEVNKVTGHLALLK